MTSPVQRFEQAFAEYVGAKYAIAMSSGTATLHSALAALGVKFQLWDKGWDGADYEHTPVAVPPLTMASTTIAVLHAGGQPVFVDVEKDTWLARWDEVYDGLIVPVALYGLRGLFPWGEVVHDAAQTLAKHSSIHAFTSYSFQASKILALGEGGMLVTNDEKLAARARSFSSLGYWMDADEPRIDPATLKAPDFDRHHSLGYNYRMSDLVAREGALLMAGCLPDVLIAERQKAAHFYREAVAGCSWITPQHKPNGWQHDYWTYAIALESAELWHPFVDAIERHGGERPYAAWRITYQEPAFRHLAEDGTCPVAEDLQPRLVQMQTNNTQDAMANAQAVGKAIKEIDG